MKPRFATDKEVQNWNKLIITNPDGGNIFQSKEFGEVKTMCRWKQRFIVVNNIYIMVLERNIPLFGYYWYVPKGPGVSSAHELIKMLPIINSFAQKNKVFTVKLEPELIYDQKAIRLLKKAGLAHYKGIQAANTALIDISRPIEDIVASFSSKTRYNIRAAKKANIKMYVAPINDNNCRVFFDMMVKTVNGRSPLRDYEYFKNYWQLHDKAKTGVFLFASFDGKIISTDFITFIGQKAYRKDAASDHSTSVRGASALLEVYAIEFLKEKDVIIYDLYGTPPSDQIKNHDHPYYGFGSFKAGFSSNITDYIGSLDLAVKPAAYKIWIKIGERLARRVYKLIFHENFY